jgi:hypothetical protein
MIPAELQALAQWVVWRYELRDGKWTKIPYNPLRPRSKAKAGVPSTWGTLESAWALYLAGGWDGIGFEFADDDPYFGADLDHCLKAGGIATWAAPIVARLASTYGEISPSGGGIKFIGKDRISAEARALLDGKQTGTRRSGMGPDGDGALECYDRGRFFALTGDVFGDAADIVELPGVADELIRLAKSHAHGNGRATPDRSPWLTTARDGRTPTERTDDELIERIRQSDQGALFGRLYDQGDTSLHGGDESGADLALMNVLAFWTGGDRERMRGLFARSALGRREKWRTRPDYQDSTIDMALAGRTEFYGQTPSADGQANSVQLVHSVHRAEEWKPITLGQTPPAPPFPLACFPGRVQELCRCVAESIGCPLDVAAGMILGVVSTAIGRSVSLMLKPGYFVNASLWIPVVSLASEGKSPALELIARPIHDIDDRLRQEYLAEKRRWETDCDLARKNKQSLPPPPTRKTLYVDDTTVEALNQIESDNPRGIGWLCDELSACVLGLNQYKAGGKGNDRPTLMKMQSGRRFKRNRKDEESLGPFSYLTVCGGIVPDLLRELKDSQGRADGFLDRCNPIFPELAAIPEWTARGVPEALRQEWTTIVERLYAAPMDVDPVTGYLKPHVIKLGEGESTFIERYNRHVGEMNARDFDQSLRGPWGKFRESAAKFALVLGCLRIACIPCDVVYTKRFHSLLDIDISHGWDLVDYFKPHFRKTKARIEGDAGAGGDDVKVLLDWFRSDRKTEFSEWDAYQEVGRFRHARGRLADALSYLARHGVVRLALMEKHGPGRNPSPRWEVNPALYLLHDAQNAPNAPNTPSAAETTPESAPCACMQPGEIDHRDLDPHPF